jgi:hypothetical protein
MDQDAFRETYREVNEVFCAFEKSVLTNECRCRRAERFCIAEREGVHCRSQASQSRCLQWLELLRNQARFALRTDDGHRLLPHGKAIRLQVGGIRGLQAMLEDATSPTQAVIDVDATLSRAEQAFGRLDRLPFSKIVRAVAAYQVRKRARRRR